MVRTRWSILTLVVLAACADGALTGPAAPPVAQAPADCVLALPSPAALVLLAGVRDRIDALEQVGSITRGQARALQNHVTSAERAIAAGRGCPALAAVRALESQLEDFVAHGVLAPDEAAPLLEMLAHLLGSAAPPEVTITHPQPGAVVGPVGTLQFSVSGADVVVCTLAGETVACSEGSVEYLLDDGVFDFTVEAVNLIGQSASASLLFEVDATSPVVTELTAIPSGSGDVQISYQLTDRSEIVAIVCTLDGAPGDFCGAGDAGEMTISGLEPGLHLLEVYGVDEHGNAGGGFSGPPPSHFARLEFEVPAEGPEVTIIHPQPDATVGPFGTIDFTVSGATVVDCTLDGESLVCAPPGWAYHALIDGPHVFTVEATDAAGRSTSATVVFEVDATPPVVTSITAVSLGPGEVRISYTLADRSEIAAILCSEEHCGAGTSGEITYSGLRPGSHIIEVFGVDVHGNSGAFGESAPPPSPLARLEFEVP